MPAFLSTLFYAYSNNGVGNALDSSGTVGMLLGYDVTVARGGTWHHDEGNHGGNADRSNLTGVEADVVEEYRFRIINARHGIGGRARTHGRMAQETRHTEEADTGGKVLFLQFLMTDLG